MAIEHCRAEIRKAAGKDIADEAIDRIIDAVRSHAKATKKPFPEAAADLSEREVSDAIIKGRAKLNAYRDLIKRKDLESAVDELHSTVIGEGKRAGQQLPLAQSIDALTRGISEAVPGARESTAAEALARRHQFFGEFQSALDKDGLMAAWRGRSETANWVRELAELNKKDGKPGITKSDVALKIAQAVKDAQDLAKVELNRSGAWIGDYDGYVSRTAHDAVAIDRAGYQAWHDHILPRLDQDRTFGDLVGTDRDAYGMDENGRTLDQGKDHFLRGVWDALSTGVHMSSDHGVGKGAAFSGPGSLGKRLAQERVLHFKDADAWREYQERFGDPVIERGVMKTLDRAARDSALMRRWGTNPVQTFNTLLRTIKEKYRDDHTALDALKKEEPRLQREFAFLTGTQERPGNSLAWKIASGTLAWQDITKLSYVLFTHLSVGATKPFQLKYLGIGRWRAYRNVISSLVDDKSEAGRSVMENLRANAEGQSQEIMSGYEPIDGVPGQISKLRAMVMRLGGLPWMIGRQKSGAQWEISNFLGQHVGKEIGDLPAQQQRALKIYGIGPKEWDVLRQAPDHDKSGSGSVHLTPQAAQRAPDTAIDSLDQARVAAAGADGAPRVRAELRDRLMMKLAAYYSDVADRTTITPGIPERAMFQGIAGPRLGPVIGQYKTWAAAAVRQMWGQAIYGSSRSEALKSLAELVAVGTSLGYLRTVATSYMEGKDPPQFNRDAAHDALLVGSSAIKGGGLGILGDMILGQIFDVNSGTGKEKALKIIATLVGPTVTDAAGAAGIGYDYAGAALQKHPATALKNADAESLRFAIDHMPFVNLFYTRLLFNWLVFDRLQESASPGYLRRYQNRVKQQTGQSFWLPPTQYAGH